MDVDPAPRNQPVELDLQTYASNYTGHAKIDRLLFVAKNSVGNPLEIEALKLAIDELKKTENSGLYRDVINRLAGRGGPGYAYDSAWADDVDRRFSQRQDLLESELSVARSNLVKESIRLSHTALGDLFYSRGDLTEAFRNYLRTRDYCTSPRQTLHMCINVVRCALEMKNYLHVGTYVQKAESSPEAATEPETMSKLRAAQGLTYITQGKYKLAATAFTSLSCDLGSSFNDVISGGDVATYGTLCGLATMDRSEVSSRMIDSATFRELLAQAPIEIRDAATDFHGSRYGVALAALDRLRPMFAMDPFLADHAESLLAAVRARALTQYTRPFASLDLSAMAAAFNTDEKQVFLRLEENQSLQSELVALIASKEISGRIDTHAKALLSTKVNARAVTYRAALDAANQYLKGTRAMLLRAGMLRHDLVQRPSGGERPERPERPDRSEGPRGDGFARGEGGRRSRGGRERDRDRERGGPGSSGWEMRMLESMDHGSGSMLAD